MAEIVLDGVTKRFKDGTEAVKRADFTIADGEFFILVGPSGCGKSTLLNMIVGLEDITEGELRIDGTVLNEVDPKDRGMAMVFQSYAIYPHMTVRENMEFPLKLAKVAKDEISRRVDQAAEMLELTELLPRKPANLSGGQRQRVAMGRAIVREPRAYLMDEPLSNLDAKLRVQMRTQLADLQNRLGVTTVYVTHDQVEAMTLGDRVAVMRKGVVQQVATPKDLYRDPVNIFVAGFIGSPSMNFLPGEVTGATVRTPLTELDLPAEVADRYRGGDQKVIVGIRPENFEDPSYVGKDEQRFGPTFPVHVDLIEWLGADIYAYFDIGGTSSDDLHRLASDLEAIELSAEGTQRIAARIDRSSDIAEGDDAELWLDTRAIHLFDVETGDNLTRRHDDAVVGPDGDGAVAQRTDGSQPSEPAGRSNQT
jgi:multiple sugar transport system ATP-binding protein